MPAAAEVRAGRSTTIAILALLVAGCVGPVAAGSVRTDTAAPRGTTASQQTTTDSQQTTPAGQHTTPAGQHTTPAGQQTTTGSQQTTRAGQQALPAVQRAIDAFNATAGGSIAAQQAELDRLLSAGQTAAQDKCPAATSTIRFEPVYAELAAAPHWQPSSGTLPGDVYALPTLIRIYSGDRITGTDLTDLHVAIDSGRAWLPALCLN